METIKRLILVIVLIICFAACSKHEVKPTPPPAVDPTATTLISPANGQPCLTGTSVGANQTTVSFSWIKADNTDNYQLNIRNLLDNTTQVVNTVSITANVNLLKSTPYEWFVTSIKNNDAFQPQSVKWRFFNSGPGITVYPPYPADAVYPANNAELISPSIYNTITLQWSAIAGSAAIVNYDIYFGTTASPLLLAAKVTGNSMPSVSYVDDTTYYWRIITRDASGNTSTSPVYTFYVY
jgi:hypothetical protein